MGSFGLTVCVALKRWFTAKFSEYGSGTLIVRFKSNWIQEHCVWFLCHITLAIKKCFENQNTLWKLDHFNTRHMPTIWILSLSGIWIPTVLIFVKLTLIRMANKESASFLTFEIGMLSGNLIDLSRWKKWDMFHSVESRIGVFMQNFLRIFLT